MDYTVYEQDEPTEITMRFIDDNNITVDKTVEMKDCKVYQRGKYILVEYKGKVAYYEHVGNFCYILDALQCFSLDNQQPWKTADRLITLRQAIRENSAQMMGLDDLLTVDMTLKQYNQFIQTARVHDKLHHGEETF